MILPGNDRAKSTICAASGGFSMRAHARHFIVIFVLLLPLGRAAAQQPSPSAPVGSGAAADLKETVTTTKHAIEVGGQRIAYTATAGTIVLRDDKNKAEA